MQASKKLIWALLFLLLFGGGIAGGYYFFSMKSAPEQAREPAPTVETVIGDSTFVRVYYPSEGKLVMEERRVKRQASATGIAEAIVIEFLKGPSHKGGSDIPAGTKLLGVYAGGDGTLYLDLSDDFRRNFQGDALSEFLLLKGLYESIISNVQGMHDVRLIIEGKETETIGGHMTILHPLKEFLSEVKER